MINKRLVAVLCLAFCGAQSRGQTAANQSFASWYHDRLVAHIDQMIERNSPSAKDVVGMNGKGSDRQKESPASDSRSTSLVDQSSATDFFSVAANVIPVPPGLSQFIPATGSTTSDSSAAGSTTANQKRIQAVEDAARKAAESSVRL